MKVAVTGAEKNSCQAENKSKTVVVPHAFARMGVPFEKIISNLQKRPPVFTNESMTALGTCNRFIDSSKARRELNYTTRCQRLFMTS